MFTSYHYRSFCFGGLAIPISDDKTVTVKNRNQDDCWHSCGHALQEREKKSIYERGGVLFLVPRVLQPIYSQYPFCGRAGVWGVGWGGGWPHTGRK